MYDEDRLHAIELYERMFDKAEDEQALLQFLVSPTRQAVLIARVYNSRERKLHVHAESRGLEEQDSTEEYITVIDRERQEAISQHIIAPEVTEGQFSLFDDAGGGTELYEYDPGAPIPVNGVPAGSVSREEQPVQADVQDSEQPDQPESAAAEAAQEPGEGEPNPEPEAEEPEQGGVDVDKFMDNFAIKDNELIPEAEAEPAAAEVPAAAEEPADKPAAAAEEKSAAPAGGTVRKPRIFLLILYIIFAVPVTAIGVVLLLVPTLLSLVLAVTVVVSGVAVLVAAFGGFTVLADFMVVLGVALMILSLGLLFTWLFVWFIGGAIVGLVRNVIELGRSWCYKEVAVA